MRVLIIGTGSIGQRHMANLRTLIPDVRFVVLRGQGRGRETAGLGTVDVVASLDDAFLLNPNLVVIASPSSMHLRPIIEAINRDVPFYAEKPIVSSPQDLAELIRSSEGRVLPPHLVGCNLRFLPSLGALKSLIDEGRLGNLVRADFEAGQWLPDWRPGQDYRSGYSANTAQGGGVLLDLIHEVDAAHWLLGRFDLVRGYALRASELEIDSDDCAGLLLARAGGPIATVRIDYVSRKPVRRYTFVGDRATATWDLSSASLVLDHATGSEQLPLPTSAFDVSSTYLMAMQELLSAIKFSRPTSQPLDAGLSALNTIFRAERI